MSSNKMELAALLQKKVFDRPISDAEKSKLLQSLVEEWAEEAPRLPAMSLSKFEAHTMFGLVEDEEDRWSLSSHDLFDPPEPLVVFKNEMKFVTEKVQPIEAFARCVIDNVLIYCLGAEKRVAMTATTSPLGESPSPRPGTPPPDRACLTLRFETSLRYKVMYKGQPRLLNGFADYTLWYGSESMATNLVVVEAKKEGALDQAEDQLTTYMGIVHRTRLDEGRDNAVIYGATSDGNAFRFYRIDNNSKIASSRAYEWKRHDEREITSFVRYILRAAIASSPSTSPLKPGAERDASLAYFKDPVREILFDYGTGTTCIEDLKSSQPGEAMDTSDAPGPV